MKLNELEEMLKSAIGYLDNYITAKAIRDVGYDLHFYNETLGCDNTDDQPIEWRGLVGLKGIPSSYITVFDGTVNPNITKTDLFRIYKPALRALHRFAVNKRYGLNCCMPADIRGMTYTLLNKKNFRGGVNYLMAVAPEKIHFNGPATVVEWNDGTKTVVKCQRGDTFDPLTGVAMCCMKKMLGTNESGSNYLNDVSKLIDGALKAKNKRYERKEKKEKKMMNDEHNAIKEATKKWLRQEMYKRELAIDIQPNDPVNHPSHYCKGGLESIDVIKAFTADLKGEQAFCAGNAIKYILRFQYKNGVEDIEKAIWYLNRLKNAINEEVENE